MVEVHLDFLDITIVECTGRGGNAPEWDQVQLLGGTQSNGLKYRTD